MPDPDDAQRPGDWSVAGWLARAAERSASGSGPVQHEGADRPDGSFETMMAEVARFHHKHAFAENNGHDMGYRLALTIEELGEFAAAVTKGMARPALAEELADVLILVVGHALALEIDLEAAFRAKLATVMRRPARTGRLGVRVTEWTPDDV